MIFFSFCLSHSLVLKLLSFSKPSKSFIRNEISGQELERKKSYGGVESEKRIEFGREVAFFSILVMIFIEWLRDSGQKGTNVSVLSSSALDG